MVVVVLEPTTKELSGLKAVAEVVEEEVRIQDLLLGIHKCKVLQIQAAVEEVEPTTVLQVVQESLL
jgi:hypothetical protein